MTNVDSQRIKEIRDNTAKMADAFTRIADALERLADRKIENCSEKPNNCEPKICDTCRYYNSNIPCGSTPSACKEADKFAEEFVEGLKKLKPTISKMEQVEDEPQTDWHYDEQDATWYPYKHEDEPQIFICPIQNDYEALIEDEPQTERSE